VQQRKPSIGTCKKEEGKEDQDYMAKQSEDGSRKSREELAGNKISK
jgi:hypothetical protein